MVVASRRYAVELGCLLFFFFFSPLLRHSNLYLKKKKNVASESENLMKCVDIKKFICALKEIKFHDICFVCFSFSLGVLEKRLLVFTIAKSVINGVRSYMRKHLQ
jgi:hypothetical protein